MKYGIIIGNKPIQNKRPDGAKGSTGGASMEYKEDESIIIGKAADGRVMKQLSVVKETGYNDYILRTVSQNPSALLDSFEILSITGSIRIPYKDTCSYSSLICTLSDLNDDYDIQELLNWYYTYTSITDTEKAILLATSICAFSFTPSVYRNRNVVLNLCVETPVLDTIISTLRKQYTEGKVNEAKYTSIMTPVNKIMSELSVHLTVTYLVKE